MTYCRDDFEYLRNEVEEGTYSILNVSSSSLDAISPQAEYAGERDLNGPNAKMDSLRVE